MQRVHFIARQGTILIIVAGISALLASLSVAFLTRMRFDVQESQQIMQEAQARIMLSAACCYIMEASRLGYDTVNTEEQNFHLEGHGWLDVRDGTVGPKVDVQTMATADKFYLNNNEQPTPSYASESRYMYRPQQGSQSDGYANEYFPIGTSVRIDMYRKKIPPYAIRLDAAPNPINPEHGIPYLSRPDPLPMFNANTSTWQWNSDPDSEVATQAFAQFKRGDPTPVANSTGIAWFRLHRCGPSHPDPNYRIYNAATFIVTVGVGGTAGFRSLRNDDLLSGPERALALELFNNDDSIFNALQAQELRQWYLVEWSPAVGGQLVFNLATSLWHNPDGDGELYRNTTYAQMPQNSSRYNSSQGKLKSFGGTIRFVQRLMDEPKHW